MKISYNWLKQYIDLDISPDETGELLTSCGLEVEAIEKYQSVKGGLEGIVIGKVLTCEKHPGADKLSKTTVEVADGKILPIVCGAPNVAAGQKVPVATVGAVMYSGEESFKIKKSKIRGEVSEGMICAEDELGLGTFHDGIMVLPDHAEIGLPASKYFDIQEDYVFEIGLTPNRADATSHIGTARDLVAILNLKAGEKKFSLKYPDFDLPKIDRKGLNIEVEVEDSKLCPRYSGVCLENIEVKESPDWMKAALEAVGIRSINNVVDITNYVMMETGQPLHAFDAAKVEGGKIVVKTLDEGVPFVSLDEEERKLSSKDLMICNAKAPMCIAGVFGGLDSGVSEKTEGIFLESAYFNPTTVRKTARRFGLNTDSSFRFERGADPNITTKALARAVSLLKEYAGAVVTSEVKDIYPTKIEDFSVEVKWRNIDRLIGISIPQNDIKLILESLDIEILSESEEGLSLRVPALKVDVTREADIIEEIIRIYGFNSIELKSDVRSCLTQAPNPDPEKVQNIVADALVANGFVEIMNNSLTSSAHTDAIDAYCSENNVKMLNPLSSELDVLRQSLLFGVMDSVVYNQNRRTSDLMVFEFGKTYRYDAQEEIADELAPYSEGKSLALAICGRKNPETWNAADEQNDIFQLKGYVLQILHRVGVNVEKLKVSEEISSIFKEGLALKFKKRKIAEFGSASLQVLKHFDIKQDVFYAEIDWNAVLELVKMNKVGYEPVSKFPEVRRDLALLVDKNIKFSEIKSLALNVEKHILKSVGIFDVYEGDKLPEGKKSYAVKFILQHPDKTLTDKLIDKTMSKFIKTFQDKLGAELR
ncbi:MAG: phenylalanine--tRNA ligase subunit beta [Bacteroidales bacterium]